MPIMNTRTIPSALDGLDAAVKTYYQEVADQYTPVYNKVFSMSTTDRPWVQDIAMAGLGPYKQAGEGESVKYDTLYEGPPSTYVLNKFHTGFGLTEDAKIFNKIWPLLKNGTAAITVSNLHSTEMVAADLLNNAFVTTKYVGGDGQAMCSLTHPLLRPDAATVSGSATYKNRPTVNYDISEAGLEQMYIDTENMVDESGFFGSVSTDQLVIPKEQVFTANRVLKSIGRVGTPDNDLNALKAMGVLQKDPIVWKYLTSTSAFFILNKSFAGPGLKGYRHSDVSATPVTWVDEATGNIYVRSRDFMVFGWSNPRAISGSPGTAA